MRFAFAFTAALAITGVASAEIGRLRIVVPADAKLIVNDVQSRNQSGLRVITTQDMEEGERGWYELEATAYRNGQWYTERKTVSVRAGYQTTIEFYFPDEQPAYAENSYPNNSGYPGNYVPGRNNSLQGGGNPGNYNPGNYVPGRNNSLSGGGNATVGTPNPNAGGGGKPAPSNGGRKPR